MSGRSSAILLLVMLFASNAWCQSLPDIGEAEIDDLKLLLLDAKGQPRGTFKAQSARKNRDGRIVVVGASLEYSRLDGRLTLTARRLEYIPGADAFEAPLGFEAALPDGGSLVVPKGSATITTGALLQLNATCEGDVSFRLGPAAVTPVEATVRDPRLAFSYAETGGIQSLSILGKRGALAHARFSRLPSFGSVPRAGTLTLRCNGEVMFEVAGISATMKLAGRVRASVVQREQTLKVHCSSLRMALLVKPGGLQPAEIDAAGGARVEAEDLYAEADQVLMVETGAARTATLTRDARARVRRDGATLEIQAAEKALLRADATSFESGWLELELFKSARLASWGGSLGDQGGKADWLVQGDYVVCERFMPALPFGPELTHFEFVIRGSGFAPVMSITGTDVQHPQSMTLAGKSAAGSLLTQSDGRRIGDFKVDGPDILATVLGPFHLVRDLRKALGLRPLDGLPSDSNEPGRVVIRAGQTARVNFVSAAGRIGALMADAQGEVEIRQEPVRRNDREMCTLRGDRVLLDMGEAGLGSGLVLPLKGEVRITLGFDLLRCTSLHVSMLDERQVATLGAPGHVVLRDPETLNYFHDAMSHVKSQSTADVPDAGWMWFGGSGKVTHSESAQQFEFHDARLVFVRGDFPKPRGGQGAFNDLDELEDGEVSVIYEARAAELRGEVELTGLPQDQLLSFSLSLKGSPSLRSRQDGLFCSSKGPMRVDSSQRSIRAQDGSRQRYALGSVLRLGEGATVRFENAARYFDEAGRLSGFSYGGVWTLHSSTSLELRFLPADIGVQEIQREVARLGRATPNWASFLERLELFEDKCAAMPDDIGEQDRTRVLEVRALLEQARTALSRAFEFATLGREDLSLILRQGALACEARAFALLGPSYAISAGGVSDLEMRDVAGAAAPLQLNMTGFEIVFSALGDVRLLEAGGPIRATRGRYMLSGKRLTLEKEGALTLDGARLVLPAEIGVEVEGASRVVATLGRLGPGRLRVYGTQLSVKASLLRPKE